MAGNESTEKEVGPTVTTDRPESASSKISPPSASPATDVSIVNEKVTSNVNVDVEKSTLNLDDEAGSIAAKALASGPLDPHEAKKLLKKIDWYILPFMCVTYGLQFLDKTTLSYSAVFGLEEDTHLVGQQYSWASSIFYFGYLIAEFPGVALLQRFPLAKFLGVNIIAWSAILLIHASCSSFAGLATVRFFLGIFEATISPGFVAITAIWWTRNEQAARAGYWVAMMGAFGMIGGLLTFGIGHITGSLSPWRYIYIILGSITFVWGFVFLWRVPDNPATAKWLTEDEKVMAVQRVIDNKTGTKTRTFSKAQMIEAITDPKIIMLMLISFVNAMPSGGLSFGSIIISGFGFTSLQTTLLNIPLSFLQAVSNLSAGYFSTRIPNSRLHIATLAMIPPIVGAVVINTLAIDNKWGRLVGVWLLASYPVGFLAVINLLSSNVSGSTKRTVASGMSFVGYCVGQIAGPQCFYSREYPRYYSGIQAMLCAYCFNFVLNQVLRFLYVRENKKRDQALGNKTEEELQALQEESRIQGFENVTDGKNVMFRYTL
ncbi:MAG: hypothetical protein M1834_003688 [Cirrosporium novae-zelandiae]|nr:MAG: hypothetical protein M1834_003688 [Cirrosporium novae-zelandiae]